jgi:pimeloyl-ACP methyl ester carboxylesterase
MRRLLILLLLLLAGPALTQPMPEEAAYRGIFSATSLGAQPISAALGLSFLLHYRGAVPHAAFALAREPGGRSAWTFVGGHPSAAAAEAAALERCKQSLGPVQAECRILATDAGLAGGPAVPLAEGGIGPFRYAPLMLKRGPAAARGVVVWGHGYGGPLRDQRPSVLPGLVAVLNDAGWDVLRFDRHPAEDDMFRSLPRLVDGLPALRAAGYRSIILGGQSRGGWQAILAGAQRPDLVATVIATAPAAHGEAAAANTLPDAIGDFRRLLATLPPAGPRLAVALFDGDEFDPSPDQRAGMLEALATGRAAPTLALWPSQDGLRGHVAAGDWRFTRLFAGCILSLATLPEAAAPRGLRRTPCGGG